MHGSAPEPARRRPPLIVGNWKMNGGVASLAEVERIAAAANRAAAEVWLALPATLIALVARRGDGVTIGAQDVHPDAGGAHTGGISAAMMRDVGARFTIVGHSERRVPAGSDDDARVARKLLAAQTAGLAVILCVGETGEDRAAGRAASAVIGQLRRAMPSTADGGWLTIAYEPRWAIGSGKVPTSVEIAAMHGEIAVAVADFLPDRADRVRVLYGGSVTPDNAADILGVPGVDGLLVGNASLSAARFLPIVEIAGAMEARAQN